MARRVMQVAAAALMMSASVAGAQERNGISMDRLSNDTRVLASDEFEGRAPGTAGETRTIAWLTEQLQQIGLEPGGPNGAWTQSVPLVRTQIGDGTMQLVQNDHTTAMTQGQDIYVRTVRPTDHIAITDAPLVFVGYGVTAPERNWDDFKGVDLRGKIAVMFVNDPDFEAEPGAEAVGQFGDRRMTYYGRWVYKYEEAARRGAIGALIIHDTPGAGYGWSTVVAGGGENYDIVRADPNERVLLQGWLSGDAAASIFRNAGLDIVEQRRAARSRAFRPIELTRTRFSADLHAQYTVINSQNVLARLPGTTRPDEVVLYGAHWDAYGQGTPDAQGNTVRPGANDDALGVAALLEIARVMKREPAPQRSVVFAFWTAEEQGLLGSEAYAVNPPYPAAKTVANIGIDILMTGGPARDVLLVGQGQNALEDDLARAAAAQGRVVTPEALPERGLFYRADHFSMARRGVPTLLFMAISGAPDLVDGGRVAGQRWLDGYMACYHQTCDRWSPDLDFRGVADDVALAHVIGRDLANSDRWPEWRAGSEFATIRSESRTAQ